MSEQDALAIIVARRGTMYDPAVVDTFLEVYRDIAPAAPEPTLQKALGRIRLARTPAPPAIPPGLAPAEAPGHASDELLAFVSLARLASRTPSVTDIGALAWGHMRHLAPGASFTLFTMDPTRNLLVAQYTAGPAAERLAGLSIGAGQRLSGWCAINGRAVVNSDARLDLADDPHEPLRFALAVPLVTDGNTAGVMTLYSEQPFAEDRSRMFEMIAPHLAVSVAAALDAAAPGEASRRVRSRSELRVVGRR